MSGNTSDDAKEQQWATAHFRDYLLHRLSEDDEERMHEDLALIPDLTDDLDEAEEDLIRRGLQDRLDELDRRDFKDRYLQGSERNQIKVKIERCLSLPEAQENRAAPAVSIATHRPPPAPIGWMFTMAAAVALICIIAALWYAEFTQNVKLRGELANLTARPKIESQEPRQKDQEAKKQRELIRPKDPAQLEQPAGESTSGFLLPAARPGLRLPASTLPEKLIWTPVPDYRQDYRIRIRFPNGQEQTSPALTPRDNSVEFSPEKASSQPLPWEILILDTGERVLARYSIYARQAR